GPAETKATCPAAETSGELPLPIFRGKPPEQLTAHSACSVPAGSLAGFGYSPSLLRPSPRTNMRASPSGLQLNSVSSWPSSALKCVSARALNWGPSAAQTLRLPWSLEHQASRSPFVEPETAV